jgi:hypothetical protein
MAADPRAGCNLWNHRRIVPDTSLDPLLTVDHQELRLGRLTLGCLEEYLIQEHASNCDSAGEEEISSE